MRYREYEPHQILADSVKCFWTHDGEFSTETEQDIPPDGCLELIFNFGNPYLLRSTSPPSPLPEAMLVGFQEKTLPLLVRGKVSVVAARLFAWGAMALLRENLTSITNSVTTLGSGFGALVRELRSWVAQDEYERAKTTLEEFLIQQALLRTYDIGLIETAAKFLHRTKGQYRISELADACNISVRQLQRGFRQVIGTSPKTFARTLRFQEAQRRLMFDPDADLTGLAYDCGYFDQAHFIKEFKAFAGKIPTEYAREMREMQDILKSKDVVFLQSPAEAHSP